MAERNKNYFDDLPDEIILKIQENMDGLTDMSTMAQVCQRFNRLASELNRRKSIYISEREFKRFSKDKSMTYFCVETLAKEVNHSEIFETLTIKLPKNNNEDYYDWNNMIELLKMIEEDTSSYYSNYIAHCRFYTSRNLTEAMIFFSPKSKGADYVRSLRYQPTNATSLQFSGKDITLLEKIVNNCKETLLEFSFEGDITFPLLKVLAKCKKLHNLILIGHFNLVNDDSETGLPKIRSKVVHLRNYQASAVSMETANMIKEVFFSDALHSLNISISLLSGVESEICLKCPNLRILDIGYASHLRDELFTAFCDNLLLDLEYHSLIYEVGFNDLDWSLMTILSDSTDRNLTVNHTLHKGSIFTLRFSRQRIWSLPSMVLPNFLF